VLVGRTYDTSGRDTEVQTMVYSNMALPRPTSTECGAREVGDPIQRKPGEVTRGPVRWDLANGGEMPLLMASESVVDSV
jgi:hypothetical protein